MPLHAHPVLTQLPNQKHWHLSATQSLLLVRDNIVLETETKDLSNTGKPSDILQSIKMWQSFQSDDDVGCSYVCKLLYVSAIV